jgi:hypothetical protein
MSYGRRALTLHEVRNMVTQQPMFTHTACNITLLLNANASWFPLFTIARLSAIFHSYLQPTLSEGRWVWVPYPAIKMGFLATPTSRVLAWHAEDYAKCCRVDRARADQPTYQWPAPAIILIIRIFTRLGTQTVRNVQQQQQQQQEVA